MHWKVSTAKNGEATLWLNNVAIYSNYRPREDAGRWVSAELDTNVCGYLLIGLGLGYHLQELSKVAKGKSITVYYFDKEEYTLFSGNNRDVWWQQSNIQIVTDLKEIDFENVQLLIPNVWLKAIGEKHPLFSMLEIIKINQVSYKKNAAIMLKNFNQNLTLRDETIKKEKQNKVACLVAAGPSLNDTIELLKVYQKDVDLFVVGAALKKLLANGVRPKATVLSDANDVTMLQFKDAHYKGALFYLSTANSKSISLHEGKRYILYQKGYNLAEEEAKKLNAPLIETGGSVGTTTFSLLEQLGYEQIVLFGQDFGFAGDNTHATLSTSIRDTTDDIFLRKTGANDGSEINTTAMFQVFLYWYNEKMERTKVQVYNTAIKGAKIHKVPLISEAEFAEIIFRLKKIT